MTLKFEVALDTELQLEEVQKRIDEYLQDRNYNVISGDSSDIVFNSEGVDKRWYLGGPMYNYVDHGIIQCIDTDHGVHVNFKFSFFLLKGIPIIFGSFLILMGFYVSYRFILILLFFVIEYLISIMIIKKSFIRIFR